MIVFDCLDRLDVDDRCFQYAFTLTQNYKEIKNHPLEVSNIKPFIYDLCDWDEIKYPTVIKNNYVLFEIKNPEFVLVEDEIRFHVHKLIKQSYVSKHFYTREKTVLLLFPDNISIKEELTWINVAHVGFCDKLKFEKKSYPWIHECCKLDILSN